MRSMDNLYGRHVCDSIPYHFAGICMYHDLKLYPWYHGEGFHRQMNMFAVGMQMKIMVGFVVLFSDRIIAAKCGKFHFYGNEKIDGTFYRRNVLNLEQQKQLHLNHGMGSSVVCKGRTRW